MELARKSKLILDGQDVGTTPMIVPSISSRLSMNMPELVGRLAPLVSGPLLVSAYDLHNNKNIPKISFPSLLFIDSGGYECAKSEEISEYGFYRPEPNEWNRVFHEKTLKSYGSTSPRVVISYDHPSEKRGIGEQIIQARELFKKIDICLKEILIKPENGYNKIKIKSVIDNLSSLAQFDIIGFTEKELGASILERMVSISTIRYQMSEQGIDRPIHILGSLDTVTTPLYFISGGDIFDGLAWLRYIFYRGDTLYLESFGPRISGIHVSGGTIRDQCIYHNYNYIRDLELKLEQFQLSKDFSILGKNANFFHECYKKLKTKMGGKI